MAIGRTLHVLQLGKQFPKRRTARWPSSRPTSSRPAPSRGKTARRLWLPAAEEDLLELPGHQRQEQQRREQEYWQQQRAGRLPEGEDQGGQRHDLARCCGAEGCRRLEFLLFTSSWVKIFRCSRTSRQQWGCSTTELGHVWWPHHSG